MLAASELGQGRFMIGTSDAISRGLGAQKSEGDLAQLQINIKTWLTKSCSTDESISAKKLSKLKNLNGIDLKKEIVFCVDFNFALKRRVEILKFVRNGGGFLLVFKPWAWFGHVTEADDDDDDVTMAELLEPFGKYSKKTE